MAGSSFPITWMLAHRIIDALSLTLDYTEQLEKLTLAATERLNMPSEMTNGLQAQRLRLAELLIDFRDELGESNAPALIDQWLFRRICDAWSLHTQNEAFWALCRKLFFMLSGDAAERLHNHVSDKVCIAHISCLPRLDRAKLSIDSFNANEGELLHITVVGESEGNVGGFHFRYEGGRLNLRCLDDYDGHFRKCFLTYAVLAMVGTPRIVYKLDDDIILDSGKKFCAHLDNLLKNNLPYAGSPVTGYPNHRKFWHGWHLGKCKSERLGTIGYQSPIGSQYAEGGFGYSLAGRGLKEIAYAFFTHQAFLEIDSILFEDAAVGMFLQLAGVALTPVNPFSSGLDSERHRMQISLRRFYSTYRDQEKSFLQDLCQHPILRMGTGMAEGICLPMADPAAALTQVPPRFADMVEVELVHLVHRCLTEQERLRLFRPRRIHLASRRLGRYFDPDLFKTLSGSLEELLEPLLGSQALAAIERISVGEQLGPPRHDTLYLVCIHLMGGEVKEIRRIRAESNSLVIGWFWDNHHNYAKNAEIARELDVCVPAHHHGSAFLVDANPNTTHPLPLCCAQWSIPTLDRLLAEYPLSCDRSNLISGRFTDWFTPYLDQGGGVGTRRRDLIRFYSSSTHSNDIRLELEGRPEYPYFSMTAQERFHDWLQHSFSLCLPVRSDLSLRFFDAIATGQLPLVDRDLAGVVLDDLSPSLIAGRDYLLVDAASPQELLETRQRALQTKSLAHREAASLRVRRGHLLEHRVALLVSACLQALQERQVASQRQPDGCRGSADTEVLEACLAALARGGDEEATEHLKTLLARDPLASPPPEAATSRWLELLIRIHGRIKGGQAAALSPFRRAMFCWYGVALIDRIHELLPLATIPNWVRLMDEQFSRFGALEWQELINSRGGSAREARQRSTQLMLRLCRHHRPCPEWIMSAARELLEAELEDEQTAQMDSSTLLALLKQWQEQLVDQAELLESLQLHYDNALQLKALRVPLSVVIPFRGKVGELRQALTSLAAQTNSDFEVIVVADGCPLEEEVLAELKALGIPTSLLKFTESRGPFAARVAGASKCVGTYLWFFDHDDKVESVFLERMLKRALFTDADVVECPLWIVPDGQPPYPFQRFEGEDVRQGIDIIDSYLKGKSHNNLTNKLIRRSLWDQAICELGAMGSFTEHRLIYCEDMLCTVLIYRLAHLYSSTIAVDYCYQVRPDSSMTSRDPDVIMDCLASLEAVLATLAPLLRESGEAGSLAAFRTRELDWCLEDLLERADHSLSADGWERVGRIQALFP